ncbi:hypothetical protein NOF04DRAFT_1308945 [Fusarium oxysporum II5]|nr:hypothetical protein NOF04DRAFT_1308945 [Fusarium oxysporum II5]
MLQYLIATVLTIDVAHCLALETRKLKDSVLVVSGSFGDVKSGRLNVERGVQVVASSSRWKRSSQVTFTLCCT